VVSSRLVGGIFFSKNHRHSRKGGKSSRNEDGGEDF